ncbi:hypothetical protein FCM35_KLT09472 [Carex littledalei]|uniref:Uncharacterized protein n=1 Tax=Carex littledalei TaxID=544730 RepID=A0A833RTT8_9POAL|nr:hypothetical protein FCM35_KLT09472 [Carex littledalei]
MRNSPARLHLSPLRQTKTLAPPRHPSVILRPHPIHPDLTLSFTNHSLPSPLRSATLPRISLSMQRTTASRQIEVPCFTHTDANAVRAPPRDFHAIRQELAAVRIQSAFHAFLVK